MHTSLLGDNHLHSLWAIFRAARFKLNYLGNCDNHMIWGGKEVSVYENCEDFNPKHSIKNIRLDNPFKHIKEQNNDN